MTASLRTAVVAIHDLTPLAWPALGAACVLLVVATKTGRKLLDRITGISLGQVKLDLTKDNSAEVRKTLQEAFDDNRRNVSAQMTKDANRFRVQQHRDAVASLVLKPLVQDADFRCTVYVPDILFAGTLYCLLDYWPQGNAAGRTYSERYGIIGRAWRLNESQAETVVKGDRDTLLTTWGMTDVEAARHTRARSFLAVVLREDGNPNDPVGVLFAEGPPQTFGRDKCAIVERAAETRLLVAALGELLLEVRRFQTDLKIFES